MERPSWIDTPQRPPGDIMRQYALHLERKYAELSNMFNDMRDAAMGVTTVTRWDDVDEAGSEGDLALTNLVSIIDSMKQVPRCP